MIWSQVQALGCVKTRPQCDTCTNTKAVLLAHKGYQSHRIQYSVILIALLTCCSRSKGVCFQQYAFLVAYYTTVKQYTVFYWNANLLSNAFVLPLSVVSHRNITIECLIVARASASTFEVLQAVILTCNTSLYNRPQHPFIGSFPCILV